VYSSHRKLKIIKIAVSQPTVAASSAPMPTTVWPALGIVRDSKYGCGIIAGVDATPGALAFVPDGLTFDIFTPASMQVSPGTVTPVAAGGYTFDGGQTFMGLKLP
jgi:hypothetical protein